MLTTVADIIDIVHSIAPIGLAESWDNVGLMLGDPSSQVTGLMLGLDPVEGLLDEAISLGANVIITHHPVIFRPLKFIDIGKPEGAFIARALKEKINIISCHTNLDSAAHGVNDVLADALGLQKIRSLVPSSFVDDKRVGMGRIGEYDQPLSSDEFVARVKQVCGLESLFSAGKPVGDITSVAVCGGSGSDLAVTAQNAGAQVYVTSEVKHSVARWAEQANFWILDAGHFSTENPVISSLARMLRQRFKETEMEQIVGESQQRAPFFLI